MIERNRYSLSNERIRLREVNEDDWKGVHRYASQNIVCQYQPWGPNTEEDSKGFVQQVLFDAAKETRSRFAFAIILDADMIGVGELNITDFTNKVGVISYIVHPDYWGKGIGTEAANLLIKFGFDDFNLHRIYATCDPRNVGSSRILQKVGMTKEGRMREDLFIKDGWRDSFLFSILEGEWHERKEEGSG
ncbi:GNAT family N-acetyltransferase [Halobacillus locisalis]|uniref:GNAT family N-acetyltransferase n=1 Tax=Halobacillus locisalis TaxID=220753 RepID=A0A838CSG0_9BACI|nr:GNAT family protein [Halobacillus locisalis]MBA2174891.1 GNAT family N-acetyltransferase [Halobacillus locisalis]